MKKIIIAMLLFFAAVFVMLQYYFTDIEINKYPDKETVVKEQAIEHGWVPALLPDSAYDIEETHDVEKDQLFGRFYYKEPDEKALIETLKLIPESNGTYEWKGFLFKIDRETNMVKYRNKL